MVLCWYGEEFVGCIGIVVGNEVSEFFFRLCDKVEMIFFCIVQEVLINIVKYVKVLVVVVFVQWMMGGIELRISDDGIGIMLEKLNCLVVGSGWGLVIMIE